MTPSTFVAALCAGTRYSSRSCLSVGCPGADSAPDRRAPKVRNDPNLAASSLETWPASPMPSTIVASASDARASARSFSSRATCVMSFTIAAILTMSAPAATQSAWIFARSSELGTSS